MSVPAAPLTKEATSNLLESWVEQHGDYLLRIARRFFYQETLAQDLVQETFLAAAESISQFEFRSSPKSWLTSILRHKALDALRRKKIQEKHFISPAVEESADSGFDTHEHWTTEHGPVPWRADPQDNAHQQQFLNHLSRCLEKLPLQSRQLFLLRELLEVPREEISRALSLNDNNVGVILHRVRLSLQGCLQRTWLSPQAEEGAP